MKKHLEKLEEELLACREIHQDAVETLEGTEHPDPAIVHMWNVLSADTALLCVIAETLHHHLTVTHAQAPAQTHVVDPRRTSIVNPAAATASGQAT